MTKDIRELQRQLSETAERLAQLEIGYLGLVDVCARTTTLLETLMRERARPQ